MYDKVVKRFLDFIIALLMTPFVLMVVIVFGILIVVDDGFPIFYNSERRGKNGKVFYMFKLRSMKNDSPDIRDKDGSTFNSENDSRLTKVGRFIRRYSIDELPQIFNVLIGDMSFIGPRPSLVSTRYEELDDQKKKRLQVLPGVTGYSQAYYRNSISQAEKIKNDCWYVDNISFATDVQIVIKTIQSILLHKNIYNHPNKERSDEQK